MRSNPPTIVIKVGGSLFDLPDLRLRLRKLIGKVPRFLLFPGGSAAADAVRTWDRLHNLGEEAAHWLALRALTMNAFFLHALLPETPLCTWPSIKEKAILEPYSFALEDENNLDHLPHTWDVTSDSLAARAARLLGASELWLLKSNTLEHGTSWAEAAKAGLVDDYLPKLVGRIPHPEVRVINLRLREFGL